VTQVYDNGLAGQFRQIVFQPLTDAGAAVGRQYSFTFQADRQRAQLRGARVYRATGAVDEAVETGEGPADSPELSMYTSARTVYVQFPRLEAGDVVELRYRIDDIGDRGDFAGYFGEVEYLQAEAPIGHAEYVVITPKDRKLYVDAQRVPGLEQSVELRGAERVHRFRADAVVGLDPEPAMPPWSEVLGFVHVSTYPSYRELGAWYWGLSRDQLELDAGTRELTQRIAAGKTTTRDKVAAVYDWVVKNTRYVALEFGIYGYKPRRSVQTVSRGWGDCKDKAAVIVAMLNELGVDASMVLVRSGHRGRFDSKVASLAPFDHAIAYVPELDLYLDGTAEFSGSRELPEMDQGALALQVNAGKAKLVTLPENNPKEHVKRREVSMRLAPSGNAELELAYTTSGASAASWRQRYAGEATRRGRVLEDLSQEFPGIEIPKSSGVTLNDVSNYEQPVSLRVRAKAPHLWREEGGALSLRVTPRERLAPLYASLPRRRLDVDLGAVAALEERHEIVLPPGFEVKSAPPNAKLSGPFGELSVAVVQEPGKVIIDAAVALSVARVSPERYAEFRKFCQAADAAFEPRLVLGARAK
jgi:transglutaminase-like putative cysteine protease